MSKEFLRFLKKGLRPSDFEESLTEYFKTKLNYYASSNKKEVVYTDQAEDGLESIAYTENSLWAFIEVTEEVLNMIAIHHSNDPIIVNQITTFVVDDAFYFAIVYK